MKKTSNPELNRLSTQEFREAEKLPVLVVLDNVRSQHNIGSIFRTCDAFRISGLVLCGITATPPHREIHKTALGAEDSVSWIYVADIVEALHNMKSEGYQVIAVEQAEGAIMLQDFRPSGGKLAFIFGNEINGVSEEAMQLAVTCVEIPQYGTKHSVNIAVSAGIILWEVFSRSNGFALFG